MRAAILVLLVAAGGAQGGTLTALRTLPAGATIAAEDIALDVALQGGLDDPAAVIGKATRTIVYQGRPILASNVVAPTLVERNQLVMVGYRSGGLLIETEARALGRGGAGDVIRVLNVASRATISARVNPDGTLSVLTR